MRLLKNGKKNLMWGDDRETYTVINFFWLMLKTEIINLCQSLSSLFPHKFKPGPLKLIPCEILEK